MEGKNDCDLRDCYGCIDDIKNKLFLCELNISANSVYLSFEERRGQFFNNLIRLHAVM